MAISEIHSAQSREFAEAIKPALEKHAPDIYKIFTAINVPSMRFEETGFHSDHLNALYELLDNYETLVKSKQHGNQCIQLGAIVRGVMQPVVAYQRKHGISLNYSHADYSAESEAAAQKGNNRFRGFDHACCKNVITRSSAAMA